ncbi:MAG: hypothetical protein HZB91_14410 [Elusimicrobia bacterium]|nr:hypothetical protein [Elusimicrobiota bacterium]
MTGSSRGLLALIRKGESETVEFKESSIKSIPVVSVRVPESRIKPVMFQGRAFKRAGSTVRASMADISAAKVKAFVRMANEKGRRPMPPGFPPPSFCKNSS